jgi:hypothetical protein
MSTSSEPQWSPDPYSPPQGTGGPVPPADPPTAPYPTPPSPGAPHQPPTYPGPYPGPPGYFLPYQPPPRTNGMAVASMVLGIVWIYWIGRILARIFGYVARKQIRERHEAGGGMATAGIVLGWVGVGVLAAVIVIASIAAAMDGSGN